VPRLLRLADVRQTAADEAPPGYRLAMVGRVDLNRLGLISIGALLVAAPLFMLLTAPLGGPIDLLGGRVAVAVGLLDVLVAFVVGALLLPVLHELIHGLAAQAVGARPVYGVAPPIAAFCHFERFVTRGQYAVIVVAPLAVITLGGLALMPIAPDWLRGQLLLLMILNASGAVGDLAMLAQLPRAPRDALIADTAVGFEAYAPDRFIVASTPTDR
jgi:hypothetical protein